MDESESESRTSLILDVQDAVMSKFPTARIRLFGSYPVGLSTFLSDIDISVDNADGRTPILLPQIDECSSLKQSSLISSTTVSATAPFTSMKRLNMPLLKQKLLMQQQMPSNKRIKFVYNDDDDTIASSGEQNLLESRTTSAVSVKTKDCNTNNAIDSSILDNSEDDVNVSWYIDRNVKSNANNNSSGSTANNTTTPGIVASLSKSNTTTAAMSTESSTAILHRTVANILSTIVDVIEGEQQIVSSSTTNAQTALAGVTLKRETSTSSLSGASGSSSSNKMVNQNGGDRENNSDSKLRKTPLLRMDDCYDDDNSDTSDSFDDDDNSNDSSCDDDFCGSDDDIDSNEEEDGDDSNEVSDEKDTASCSYCDVEEAGDCFGASSSNNKPVKLVQNGNTVVPTAAAVESVDDLMSSDSWDSDGGSFGDADAHHSKRRRKNGKQIASLSSLLTTKNIAQSIATTPSTKTTPLTYSSSKVSSKSTSNSGKKVQLVQDLDVLYVDTDSKTVVNILKSSPAVAVGSKVTTSASKKRKNSETMDNKDEEEKGDDNTRIANDSEQEDDDDSYIEEDKDIGRLMESKSCSYGNSNSNVERVERNRKLSILTKMYTAVEVIEQCDSELHYLHICYRYLISR